MNCMDFEPPKNLGCNIQTQLQQKVVQYFINKHNENLSKILESELPHLGIKPPFTKGKMKWHGIKSFTISYE
jgi:hypothetical protein